MTLDELKQQMKELGYGWQEHKRDTFRVGLFFKRIATKRPCSCNNKDQLTVEVYDYEGLPGSTDSVKTEPRFRLTADLTGEFPIAGDAQWARLQVYGLTPEQFIQRHKEIESALIRAWEALA